MFGTKKYQCHEMSHEHIPPTLDAFKQHIARASFQGAFV